MNQRLQIGTVGMGKRGMVLLETCLLPRADVQVAAVCDVYEDRAAAAAQLVQAQYGAPCLQTTCAQDLLDAGLDCLLLFTSWEHHVDLACAALAAGLAVGMEVGGAYSMEDCWKLVRSQETHGGFFMMLENCCFGREELMVWNMVQQGVFGEVVHCSGGYRHDLREEIATGATQRHYRLQNYMRRNAENYPTHELGPIANILGVQRGNRMLALHSMSSKAAGLAAYAAKHPTDMPPGARVAQGDVVTTAIRCAGGETIHLTLDTTLPRAYSRGFTVQGTAAMYMEDNRSLFLDGVHNEFDLCWHKQWNNVEAYRGQYEHPLWRRYLQQGVRGGHDGMDWLEFDVMFSCLRTGRPSPVDVYDAAAWMSITAASEASLAAGGAVVPLPDFTGGRWLEPRAWYELPQP